MIATFPVYCYRNRPRKGQLLVSADKSFVRQWLSEKEHKNVNARHRFDDLIHWWKQILQKKVTTYLISTCHHAACVSWVVRWITGSVVVRMQPMYVLTPRGGKRRPKERKDIFYFLFVFYFKDTFERTIWNYYDRILKMNEKSINHQSIIIIIIINRIKH